MDNVAGSETNGARQYAHCKLHPVQLLIFRMRCTVAPSYGAHIYKA